MPAVRGALAAAAPAALPPPLPGSSQPVHAAPQVVAEARAARRPRLGQRHADPPAAAPAAGRLSRLEDGLRDFVYQATLHLDAAMSALLAWLLLSTLFDFCAVFAVPAGQRQLAGKAAAAAG